MVAQDTIPIYLQQNRVDYVEISAEQYGQVKSMPGIDVYVYEALSYNYICFNMRQERFADAAVRQAITYGFDRQTYVDVILEGFGIVANAPMPTASWLTHRKGWTITSTTRNWLLRSWPMLVGRLVQMAFWRRMA